MSILIGTSIMFILSGSLNIALREILINVAYSLMIGVGLFANGYIFNSIENHWLSWTKHPVRSLIIAFSITTIYSSIIIWGVNYLWFIVIMKLSLSAFKAFVINIIISEYFVLYVITLFMFARAFFNEWRTLIISEQQLKQHALELQYKVLSNQVNPHFLFNSLNTLSSLINIDTERAQSYVNKLSSFYRDLLSYRGKDIISLKDEILFVNQYIALQKERFGNNIEVKINIDNSELYQVIPMTIQMLVENAIKHNQISKDNPLTINIQTIDKHIKITNNIKPYNKPIDGEKLGLSNLKERYKYLSNSPFELIKTEEQFIVNVPLLTFD
ncbi:sensor histidine kinase [Saccharicrinis aurantiacus]|uniref:sensor histidine kinase n=1 Tax=Saccharicrinis aurantiacus TaxID=1849719 RepID=UPI00248FF970|nr:histidine kinase [Saccharicrinis aurantiacus]